MSRRGTKISNEYAAVLQPRYGDAPKAVIAAVAVSLLLKQEGSDFAKVYDAFVREWATLYASGIVSQKPITTCKAQEADMPALLSETQRQLQSKLDECPSDGISGGTGGLR
jgi:hypothetical protein